MTEVLAIDSGAETLEVIDAALSQGGYQVRAFSSCAAALQSAFADPPAIVICNTERSSFDGYGLLSELRAHGATKDIPLVLIDDAGSDEGRRMAMLGGANGYLTKPIDSELLLETVKACLAGSSPSAVIDSGDHASLLAQSDLGDTARIDSLLAEANVPRTNPRAYRLQFGTLLFFDIRGFTTMSEKMQPDEVAELLEAFFTTTCEPILQQEGWIVKFAGDAALAMFDHVDGEAEHHAVRALRAALFIVQAAVNFQPWLVQRFPQYDFDRFSIGVGVHSGSVAVCSFDVMGEAGTTPTVIGDAVNVAARLEECSKELGWSIVASRDTIGMANERIEIGRRETIAVRGRAGDMEVCEVVGLSPRDHTAGAAHAVYQGFREAVVANAGLLEKNAYRFLPSITGYRIVRPLGQGGMSDIYLCESEDRNTPCVIKLVPIREEENGELIHRFIQEYALISRIKHPNVARIFAQGFTATHAYISMEYLSGGDLRTSAKSGVVPEVALNYVRQIALALQAIHKVGIVHRDLKPNNVMLRPNGTLVLADFGIAKDTVNAMTATHQGQVFGTPYYISPEQVRGCDVGFASDFYSLGVMLFELLTGRHAYQGANVDELLRMHVEAAPPALPTRLAHLQPLIEALMAKSPSFRIADAAELLALLPVFERRVVADAEPASTAPVRSSDSSHPQLASC